MCIQGPWETEAELLKNIFQSERYMYTTLGASITYLQSGNQYAA